MNHILILLGIGFFMAMILGRAIIPKILVISSRKKLFDIPDSRKVHKKPISRLGGISFFPAIMFSLTFIVALCSMNNYFDLPYNPESSPEILLFMSGVVLLFLIGIADDLVGVRYRSKFFIQIISAMMIPLSGLYINDLYGIFGIHSINEIIGIPLTILMIVFIVNAINLIDGIDGLASGLSIVALGVYLFLFLNDGLYMYALLCSITLGVVSSFFFYNVFGDADRGRKIFMGDTGSLTLGYILSFLTIKYVMNTYQTGFNYDGAILIAFGVLMVPCLDVCRVFIRRVRNGKNPFLPDKTHIHHKFIAMGFTVRQALIIILGMSFAFCMANLLLVHYVDNTLLLVMDIILWTGLNVWFDKVIENRKSKI